jgi:hypothetical protein
MLDPVALAEAFVGAEFPECDVAFLAGSVVRGEATSTSDLDIVVITGRQGTPYRESFLKGGWPIEVFVHNERSYLDFFASDRARYEPKLQQMCLEGIVLRDPNGLAERIREEARRQIEAGPEPLTSDKFDRLRYALTDLLDDFVGTDREEEAYFIAHDLASASARLILLSNGRWLGGGKWLLRALRSFDPALAEQLATSMSRFFRSGKKAQLIAFAEGALASVGGRLFEGYRNPPTTDSQGTPT